VVDGFYVQVMVSNRFKSCQDIEVMYWLLQGCGGWSTHVK
jgi:hypothetical protein